MAPRRDLLIGLGNSLRGDDGVGVRLAAWAERRWPALRVCSVQQLMPELSCELATARRVLFVDAWRVPELCGGWVQDCSSPPGVDRSALVSPGPTFDGCSAPVLWAMQAAGAAGAAAGEAGAFSHRLDPAQLLAITALLHGDSPPAWQLLIPAFRFPHDDTLSPELLAQLPAAEALLSRWCSVDAASSGQQPCMS